MNRYLIDIAGEIFLLKGMFDFNIPFEYKNFTTKNTEYKYTLFFFDEEFVPNISNMQELYFGHTHLWLKNDNIFALIQGEPYNKLDLEKKNIVAIIADNIIKVYLNGNSVDFFFETPMFQRIYVALLKNLMIIHGAYVVDNNNNGVLFLGDSGAGKSTLCHLFQKKGYNVISDDRVILKIINDSIFIFGTPWNKKNKKYNINCFSDLRNILLLKHNCENKLIQLDNNTAIKKFIKQVYLPFTNELTINRIKEIYQILHRVKSYDFGFIPNCSAVTYVTSLIN